MVFGKYFRTLPTDGFGASNLVRFDFPANFFGACPVLILRVDSGGVAWGWGCGGSCGVGVRLWRFLGCRGWVFVGVGKFSPAGSSRNPLRRPATFSWLGGGVAAFCGVGVGRLGVCAATLDAGLSRPSSTNPRPRRPVAKETGRQKPTPTGVSLWPTLAACGWQFAPATAQAGPGTPGGALRPGPTGVCALRKTTIGPGTPGGALRPGVAGVCAPPVRL